MNKLFPEKFGEGILGHAEEIINPKIKQLKDLEVRRPKGLELPYIDWYKENLKEDAINDIKLFIEQYNLGIKNLPTGLNITWNTLSYLVEETLPGTEDGVSIIAYIMFKNNLTAEDLKDYYIGVDYAKGKDQSVVNGEILE